MSITVTSGRLQTISELCENQVSDTIASDMDSTAEPSPQLERQQATKADSDSIDEGIGTHSESGSDEHDVKHPESSSLTTPEQSQRTDKTTLPHHRKAIYKRSKSLNHIDCRSSNSSNSKPVTNLDIKEARIISVMEGVMNTAFISDYNSNELTFMNGGLQRERYASEGRHRGLTRLFSLCSCSPSSHPENKPSSTKTTVLSCTRL